MREDVVVDMPRLFDMWQYLYDCYEEGKTSVPLVDVAKKLFDHWACIDQDHLMIEKCSGCLQWLAWMGVFEGSIMCGKNPVVNIVKVKKEFRPTV